MRPMLMLLRRFLADLLKPSDISIETVSFRLAISGAVSYVIGRSLAAATPPQ